MGLDVEYNEILKPTKKLIEEFIDEWDNHRGYRLCDHYYCENVYKSFTGKKLLKTYKDRIVTADMIPSKIASQERFGIKNFIYEKYKLEFPKGVFFYRTVKDIISDDGFSNSIVSFINAHKDFKLDSGGIIYVTTQEQLESIQKNVRNSNPEESVILNIKKLPKYHFIEFWF